MLSLHSVYVKNGIFQFLFGVKYWLHCMENLSEKKQFGGVQEIISKWYSMLLPLIGSEE